jgi:hypothetical protein
MEPAPNATHQTLVTRPRLAQRDMLDDRNRGSRAVIHADAPPFR